MCRKKERESSRHYWMGIENTQQWQQQQPQASKTTKHKAREIFLSIFFYFNNNNSSSQPPNWKNRENISLFWPKKERKEKRNGGMRQRDLFNLIFGQSSSCAWTFFSSFLSFFCLDDCLFCEYTNSVKINNFERHSTSWP